MTQFRIRRIPHGVVPDGRTLVVGAWHSYATGLVTTAEPAVLEYRNPITGPTLWTAVDIVEDKDVT